MRSFFFRKNQKQLEAVFDWLSGFASRDDVICLERGDKKADYIFDFPLKIGDKPRRVADSKGRLCSFLIRLNFKNGDSLESKWLAVFRSPEIEVFVSQERMVGKEARAIITELNDKEKVLALKIARRSLEFFLLNNKLPSIEDLDINEPLSNSFNFKATLDVALWAGGILRGSRIVENTLLKDGLIEAAIFSVRDPRFKPIEARELGSIRIEITLISDLKIPLSEDLVARNEIFYEKGYLFLSGEKKGWFLPEVFNARKFVNLNELIYQLAREKAGINQKEILNSKTDLFIFEVDDFIESADKKGLLKLNGPLVVSKKMRQLSQAITAAADWLLSVQEADGNFIPVIDVLTGKNHQIDWPRSALSGLSLIELGSALGRKEYIEAGRKSFFYLKKYLLDESFFGDSYTKALALAYLGQVAVALDRPNEARLCGNKILELEKFLKFEPILFSQIGSSFIKLLKFDQRGSLETALRFAQEVKKIFDENLRGRAIMNLATWAELANLYLEIFRISKDRAYFKEALNIIKWFSGYQHLDGSFFASTDGGYPYVRGTGKIIEVLSAFLSFGKIDVEFESGYYKNCALAGFDWLAKMQYDDENTFFVPAKTLPIVLGGLRHDYFNQDVWIDSAAHFVLAGSRLLKSRSKQPA